MRLPVDGTAATAGRAALGRAGLTYLFSRETGDDPFARDPQAASLPSPRVSSPVDMADAETVMRRVFYVPVARRFAAQAWVAPLATASDAALDRLTGTRGAARATSSDRFQGQPGRRAAMALDGDPSTAWVGSWSSISRPWLQVSLSRRVVVRDLRLTPAQMPVRRPTSVTVSWPGGSAGPLIVDAAGTVTLPRAVRVRRLRLTIENAAVVPGSTPAQRSAVGIGELMGLGRAARLRVRRSGPLSAGCGAAGFTVGNARIALRVSGTITAFDAGTPLRAVSCGGPLRLAAGPARLTVSAGPLAIDALKLSSPPPSGPDVAPSPSGRVLSPGTVAHGAYNGVRVRITAPSWLVLGEGYNRGWQASCNGRALGAPVPIDGYANGWPVGPGCRDVSFRYGPNQLAKLGYGISVLACLACVIVLMLAWRRRQTRAAEPPQPFAELTPAVPARRRIPAALAAALVPALGFAFVFGLRPGVLAWPALALILWRGIGAGALTLTAAALLGLLVPVLYLVGPGPVPGGNQYGYAMAHLNAHYVAVAAFGLLATALWRSFPRRAPGLRNRLSGAGRGSR